jgi:D-alanine transaminase
MLVYFNGKIIDKSNVHISPDDRGFLFGDGIYEVIRAYRKKLFRSADHFDRFFRNLEEVKIGGAQHINYEKICEELLERNNLLQDAKLYIQVTRGVAPRKHSFPMPAVPPTIYLEASQIFPPLDLWQNGVKIILRPDQRHQRCDIKSISLQPSVIAIQEAAENGAEEVIFVKDGYVTEGSHTSFCMVKNNQIITYPLGKSILPGITRKVIQELCLEQAIDFTEQYVSTSELPTINEMFILGTITEIMPVIQVENTMINHGKIGTITRKLQQAFRSKIAQL